MLYTIMEIHLVRHIEPSIEKGICYGQLDVAIPENYQQQHQQIINDLSKDFDAIFSSPLNRCKLLADQFSDNVIFDKRLMEVNFGDWEGKNWNDINQTELNTWMENYITISPPNGESLTELLNRFSNFITEIKVNNYNKVLIFTHAGIIRCAMNLFNQTPLDKVMMEKADYGKGLTFFT